ncbi:hypothetical protein H311_03279, partial [Anncaliia algerae PRA109]
MAQESINKSITKNDFIKSIYLKYLYFKVVTTNYHKLNSTCDSSVTFQRSLDKYNTSTITPPYSTSNSITVEYTLLNTDITLKRTIFPLNSLHLDLFIWVSHFRETVKLCRWEEATAVEVLKSLLPLDLL